MQCGRWHARAQSAGPTGGKYSTPPRPPSSSPKPSPHPERSSHKNGILNTTWEFFQKKHSPKNAPPIPDALCLHMSLEVLTSRTFARSETSLMLRSSTSSTLIISHSPRKENQNHHPPPYSLHLQRSHPHLLHNRSPAFTFHITTTCKHPIPFTPSPSQVPMMAQKSSGFIGSATAELSKSTHLR
jgi:hypothetical protein